MATQQSASDSITAASNQLKVSMHLSSNLMASCYRDVSTANNKSAQQTTIRTWEGADVGASAFVFTVAGERPAGRRTGHA
jgi:hypothetical protein